MIEEMKKVDIHISSNEIDLELALSEGSIACSEDEVEQSSCHCQRDNADASELLSLGSITEPPLLALSGSSQDNSVHAALSPHPSQEESFEGHHSRTRETHQSVFVRFLNILANLTRKKAAGSPLLEPLLPLSHATLENTIWLEPYSANSDSLAQAELGLVFSNASSQDDLDIEEVHNFEIHSTHLQPISTFHSVTEPVTASRHAHMSRQGTAMWRMQTVSMFTNTIRKCCKAQFVWSLIGLTLIVSVIASGAVA